MIELAIWLGTLLLLFVGLLIGLYVLRNIFYEGIERQRSGSKPESPGEGSESEAEASGNARGASERGISASGPSPSAMPTSTVGADTEEAVVCSTCETRNEATYTYCQECTQRL